MCVISISCKQTYKCIFTSFTQGTNLDQRDDLLKLAEFKLLLMSAAVKMLSDGSMNASVKLADCTLDDERQAIHKATPRSVFQHEILFNWSLPKSCKYPWFASSVLLNQQIFYKNSPLCMCYSFCTHEEDPCPFGHFFLTVFVRDQYKCYKQNLDMKWLSAGGNNFYFHV